MYVYLHIGNWNYISFTRKKKIEQITYKIKCIYNFLDTILYISSQ